MRDEEFRQAGHRLVDLLADYLDNIEGRPLFSDASPDHLRALFDEPMPAEPAPMGDVLSEIESKLLPHCTHVGHPGYFGLITPTPLPAGILGDLLASGLNQNVGAWSIGLRFRSVAVRWRSTGFALQPIARKQAIRWFKAPNPRRMAFPRTNWPSFRGSSA